MARKAPQPASRTSRGVRRPGPRRAEGALAASSSDAIAGLLAQSRVPHLSLGIDIEQVARVEKLLKQHPGRFLDRVFTAGEVAHSAGRRNRAQHLAARFACKEAVMKALGTGLTSGITWRDIEVVTLPSGKPVIKLHAAAQAVAAARSISRWEISLSHTKEIAVAVAVGW